MSDTTYECGCEAGGDLVSLTCPTHGSPAKMSVIEQVFGRQTVDYLLHEVFHLISVQQGVWEDYVENHAAIIGDKDLKERAGKISELMAGLYAKIGEDHMGKCK